MAAHCSWALLLLPTAHTNQLTSNLPLLLQVHFVGLYNDNRDPKNFDNLFWPLHDVSLGELGVFFGHLADLGYGVVSREDNTKWGPHCCSEFTLLKIEKPPECT